MSKELILKEGKYTYIQHESGKAEALRYGEHWRDLTGDKFIGAMADRIEELERDLLNLVCRIHRDGGHYIAKYGEAKAIADADTVAAQNNADLDALQADNARLREALEYCVTQVGELATVPGIASALSSTTEQSLAEYRNNVIEAFVNEFTRHVGGDGEFWLHELQDFAMKEQP